MNANEPTSNVPTPGRNIGDLREALFDQLARLKADPSDAEVRRAGAITAVAGRIIESAKVEVEFVKVTGGVGTGFLEPIEHKAPALPPGMTQGTVHRLKG